MDWLALTPEPSCSVRLVRERLQKEGARLQGVYAGQPGRKTARPSAELLLGVILHAVRTGSSS
jgi:hypothetical protein